MDILLSRARVSNSQNHCLTISPRRKTQMNTMPNSLLSLVFAFGVSWVFSASASMPTDEQKPLKTMVLHQQEKKNNFVFQEGVPNRYEMIAGEKINFNDVTLQPALKEKCFTLKNKTPRSFKSLQVLAGGYSGNTEKIDAFTDYTFCVTEEIDSAAFSLGSLPNPKFNIQINGFWSDSNPKFTYFTKRQKEQLTHTLVELRYMLNREHYKPALLARLGGDVARTEKIISTLDSASRVLRPFMLNCCAEGLSAGDWFAVHAWRYGAAASDPKKSFMHDTTLHEISHNLGYGEGDAYPIGYAAEGVISNYYKDGTLVKYQPIYE